MNRARIRPAAHRRDPDSWVNAALVVLAGIALLAATSLGLQILEAGERAGIW